MSDEANLSQELLKAETAEYPDFYGMENTLDMSLWILWVAKEELGVRRLTAKQIAALIREKEVSINARSVTNSLSRSGVRVHIHKEQGSVHYEIMKSGKDHLVSKTTKGSIEAFYFEPGKRFTTKRLLSEDILGLLKSDLRIVDPYCGRRTLDILSDFTDWNVKFLTRVDHLKGKKKDRFFRELDDFKSEHPRIEFRDYPYRDIHDRYVLATERLVVLGHSIKDLGAKESFAIVLDNSANRNIFEALAEAFERRWKKAKCL